MKIDTKVLVPLLNKLNVSISQFLFLIIIHDKLYASLYSYEELNAGFSQEERDDLVAKGYITLISNSKDNYVDQYETTDKFEEYFYTTNSVLAGEEFWDLFPPYIVIDGRKMPAKSTDKEKFIEIYYKKVGKYKYLHDRVMEALRYAIANHMVCMGIEKWFLSEQWESIQITKSKEQSHVFPSDQIF